MKPSINDIVRWCYTVHAHNLRSIRKACMDGKVHQLLPHTWDNTDALRLNIFTATDIVLKTRKSNKLGDL